MPNTPIFSRLLDLLERQVAAFQVGEQPNYDLMLDIIHYLRNYPDRVHHPQENVAFARLLERDSTLKPQIDRLLQEHRVIAAAGSTLLEHLDEVVAGALVPRSIVETAAATYLTYFRQHMATEDKDVIPAQRNCSHRRIGRQWRRPFRSTRIRSWGTTSRRVTAHCAGR